MPWPAICALFLLLLTTATSGASSFPRKKRIPNIHDWIHENIYVCDLDPIFGRTRFLSREEAVSFRCRCGDPTKTKLACAQHLEQRPFCAKMPSACYDEWAIQYGGPAAPFSSHSSSTTTTTTTTVLPTIGVVQSSTSLRPTFNHPTLIPDKSVSLENIKGFVFHDPPQSPLGKQPKGVPFKKELKHPITTVAFETFPSVEDLNLTEEERDKRQKESDNKLPVEFREERSRGDFIKKLVTTNSVRTQPSVPLPSFAAELTPAQVVEVINHKKSASDTDVRIRSMVESSFSKLMEEEILLQQALREKIAMEEQLRKENELHEHNRISAFEPFHGEVKPAQLTNEDFDVLRRLGPIVNRNTDTSDDISHTFKDEEGKENIAVRKRLEVLPPGGKGISTGVETTTEAAESSTTKPTTTTSTISGLAIAISEFVPSITSTVPVPTTTEHSTTSEEPLSTTEINAKNVAQVMARLLLDLLRNQKDDEDREKVKVVKSGFNKNGTAFISELPMAEVVTGQTVATDLTVEAPVQENTTSTIEGIFVTPSEGLFTVAFPSSFTSTSTTTTTESPSSSISTRTVKTATDSPSTSTTRVAKDVVSHPSFSSTTSGTRSDKATSKTTISASTATSPIPSTDETVELIVHRQRIPTTTVRPKLTSSLNVLTSSPTKETTTLRAKLRRLTFTTSSFNPRLCEDNNSLCKVWMAYGECDKNPAYMLKYCRLSCGICAWRR